MFTKKSRVGSFVHLPPPPLRFFFPKFFPYPSPVHESALPFPQIRRASSSSTSPPAKERATRHGRTSPKSSPVERRGHLTHLLARLRLLPVLRWRGVGTGDPSGLGLPLSLHSALLDLDNDTAFFGIFDGHGGKVVAKFCAKYLHREVRNSEAYAAGDLGAAVHRAFFRMDEMMRGQRGWRELQALGDKINQFTGIIEGLIWSPRGGDSNDRHDDWAFEEGPHSDFTGPNCGSTACVALIRNRQLIVANAGDSRCVISRNGQAYNLSRDHKPELEAEREDSKCRWLHPNGAYMEFKQNKFLSPDKQILTANPDVNVVELCDDDDFLVLACDGIWDCMSSQQLVDFIREHINTEDSLSAVCERVLDRCLAPSTMGGEGCDNMTMILVQFKKPITQIKEGSGAEQSAGDTERSETHVPEENGS